MDLRLNKKHNRIQDIKYVQDVHPKSFQTVVLGYSEGNICEVAFGNSEIKAHSGCLATTDDARLNWIARRDSICGSARPEV